jgi:hypothetical protein
MLRTFIRHFLQFSFLGSTYVNSSGHREMMILTRTSWLMPTSLAIQNRKYKLSSELSVVSLGPVGVGSIVKEIAKEIIKMITFDPFIFTSLCESLEKLTLISHLLICMHRFVILRLDRTLYPISLVSRRSRRRTSVNARVNV